MSVLSTFFKNKGNAPPVNSLVSESVSVEKLRELIPIRNFSAELLDAFAADLKPEMYPKGSTLFRLGEDTDSALYLLNGIVMLSDDTGKTYEIKNETVKARFPLCSGSKHTTTAVAETDVSILRVSEKIMATRSASSGPLSQLLIPEELVGNRLLQAFADHYTNEKLELPCFPSIAAKLQNTMQLDAACISEAAIIIQLDPVIAAKLIELANCPLYVCATPAKSCFEAVKRIGLNAARNLVISLSLHQVFKSHSPLITNFLDKIWKQSIYISALSFVLARLTKQVNPEEALLAGLICDLGTVPFLHFVNNLPKDYYTEADLRSIMACVKGPIGYKILVEWGFSEEFIKVPVFSDDWYQNNSKELSLTDIVVLSRLHSEIGRTDMANLPAITSIPAAGKLKNCSLSPEHSLKLLHDAKQQINEALKILSG